MTTKRQVPYIKPSLKPIRPKPQVLCDSKEKHSLALIPSSVTVKSSKGEINQTQNISNLQKKVVLFNYYGKNKSMPYNDVNRCQKIPDTDHNYTTSKNGLSSSCAQNFIACDNNPEEKTFVASCSKVSNSSKINVFNVVTPHIINLGNKTCTTLKEEKQDQNQVTFVDAMASNYTNQQLHCEVQNPAAITVSVDKCNKSHKHSSDLFSKKLTAKVKKKINSAEKKLIIELIKTKPKHNELNIILTENFENNSRSILKRRESAILKTFAKIAPCSPTSNKARNFFTIKRNGKRSLLVCRNVKERQLQFLPPDYCNDDRCCPNLLKEFGIQEHSLLNTLEKVVDHKSESSEEKKINFLDSFDEKKIYNNNTSHILPTQCKLNSDLSDIQVKEEYKKDNLEIITNLKTKIHRSDVKKTDEQLLCFSKNKVKFDDVPKILNDNESLKCEIPIMVPCSLDQSRRKCSDDESAVDTITNKPIIKKLVENAKDCSVFRVITDQKANNNLDVATTKFDLNSNPVTSTQIREILQKYPRIAPRMNYTQDNFDTRNEKKSSIVYHTSLKHNEISENRKNSMPVFKKLINGNIKNRQDNLSSGFTRKSRLKNIDHEKNIKKLKVSSDTCSKKSQSKKVMKTDRKKVFLQGPAFTYGSKQEKSKICCSISQYNAEVNVNIKRSAENNNSEVITCIPKIAGICLPINCNNPTDNIDLKLLSFTELTSLSQKLGEEVFNFLTLDEITEKAILEWTKPGVFANSCDSSASLPGFSKESIQINSERMEPNCCSVFYSSHQRNMESDPCLHLCRTRSSQQLHLNSRSIINSINYGSNNPCNKKDAHCIIEDGVVYNNSFSENNSGTNDMSKNEFLNQFNLHRSDNVFGISVLRPTSSQNSDSDYVKNPYIPLHRVIKACKSLRKNCAQSRNCSKTDYPLNTSGITPISTEFVNEKALSSSMHNVSQVEPVLKNTKGKCLVIPSSSRHKGACLLIPVQTTFTSAESTVTNCETLKNVSSSIYGANSVKFLPIHRSSMLTKRKINQFSYFPLPKSAVIKCQTFLPVTNVKHNNVTHLLDTERTTKRSSTSQKSVLGDSKKIPNFSVITHCCTSSHHSNLCCDINNKYHRITKLC